MGKMTSIPIATASEAQLREFAEVQQYDIAHVRHGDVPGLLAVIQTAWQGDTILAVIEDGAAASPAFAQEAPVSLVATHSLTGGTGANDPKVILKVGQTTYPGGSQPVPLGHNGTTVVLQRNILTEVPYRYYLVLQDAIRGDMSQEQRDDGKVGAMIQTEYTNYPLQHVTMPSAEEIAAWHARVDNVSMPA